jgi:hypothetical protein
MYFRKLSSFVLVVFGSSVLAVPSVTSTDQPAHRHQFNRISVQLRVAGVRAPAPRHPTLPASRNCQSTLSADGGGPVPPYPPPQPIPPSSSNAPSILIVDGGGPVPPYPPPLSSPNLVPA